MKIIDIDILSAFFYNENSKKRKGGFLWNLTPASEIQTIRSEQFFNLTGQIGFRLNF